MTEKELKKMNRYQLLELLIAQTERSDQLQASLEEKEKQLQELDVKISSLGSIAEAALQLQGVFEASQKAADMYLEAAKVRAKEIEEEACKKADAILARAKEEAGGIRGENTI